MKRFLLRPPLFRPTQSLLFLRPTQCLNSLRFQSHQNVHDNHVGLMVPIAVNIDLNSDILKSLQLRTSPIGKRTRYELLTQETRNVRVAGSPIKTLEEWRSICEAVLENGRCYPESVLDTLMSECRNLVYSPPNSRRALLDDIKTRLLEDGYPMSSSLYNTYLVVLFDLRQDVDLHEVFNDLEKLGLTLNYDAHADIELADSICTFLALQGDMDYIHKCWDSFVRSRKFRGFSDKSFGIIASGHIMNGEFDELLKLQTTLDQCDVIRGYESFYQYISLTLARTGNLDLLSTLLRKHCDASVTSKPHIFWKLCAELIERGHEDFIPQILPLFEGLRFGSGRYLEKFVCDVMSRGAVRFGGDLVVHGGDIFSLDNERQQSIFELETLPDIVNNMPDNLDNIMIQLELRGIQTNYAFDFNKIENSVVHDMDKLEGEFPAVEWLSQLYDDKMSKIKIK